MNKGNKLLGHYFVEASNEVNSVVTKTKNGQICRKSMFIKPALRMPEINFFKFQFCFLLLSEKNTCMFPKT